MPPDKVERGELCDVRENEFCQQGNNVASENCTNREKNDESNNDVALKIEECEIILQPTSPAVDTSTKDEILINCVSHDEHLNQSPLYEDLSKLVIEEPEIQPKVPSAPPPSLVSTLVHSDLDLPCDKLAAEVAFPQLFEDCIDKVIQDQDSLSKLKPFTEEQLLSFYENPLLFGELAVLESFLNCRNHLEMHPLYESLSSFLRSRLSLKSAMEELEQLNKDIETCASQLWTVETRKAIAYGECADSKRVKAEHD